MATKTTPKNDAPKVRKGSHVWTFPTPEHPNGDSGVVTSVRNGVATIVRESDGSRVMYELGMIASALGPMTVDRYGVVTQNPLRRVQVSSGRKTNPDGVSTKELAHAYTAAQLASMLVA